MRVYWYGTFFLWVIFLGAGCSLVRGPEPVEMFHVNGPYWDGPAQNFTSSHVLLYRQQLRTLSKQAIIDEAKRAREAHEYFNRPVDQIQYLLILDALPPSPENKQVMEDLFSALSEDRSFLRTDVQELVFLIKTIVSSKLASQLQSSSIESRCQEFKDSTAEFKTKLEACEEESKALADQIQKLKDIERILNDRELSIEK